MSNFTIDLEKQLSKLGKDIQEFVERTVPGKGDATYFNPLCDVIESDSMYTILVDLPGMSKKDVKITLKHHVLNVSGEREFYLDDGEQLVRNERKQGAFSKAFAVPEQVDESSVSASFTNGVLKITLKKTGMEDDAEATSIPIK
jgi:HSP20 family protein